MIHVVPLPKCCQKHICFSDFRISKLVYKESVALPLDISKALDHMSHTIVLIQGHREAWVSIRLMEITQVMESKGTKQGDSLRLGKMSKLQASEMSG